MVRFDNSDFWQYPPEHDNVIWNEEQADITIEHHRNMEDLQIWWYRETLRKAHPLAMHHNLEFLYCVNESPVEYYIGAERYQFQKGDLMLLDSCKPHCLLLPNEKALEYKRYGLFIDPDYFQSVTELYLDHRRKDLLQNPVIHLNRNAFHEIIGLFESGEKEVAAKGPCWQLAMKGLAIRILCLTIRAALDGGVSSELSRKNELIDHIVAYIEEHYADRITLEAAAQQFSYSESTISHTVKKRLGVSFYAYVTQRRMLAAGALISQGVPAGEASVQVGFEDYASFLRLFKKTYGLTPRQFKSADGV